MDVTTRALRTWADEKGIPDLTLAELDYRLVHALQAMYADPFLADRLCLKGGTALNKVYILNRYRFEAHLPTEREAFPLLVYSWLQSGLGSSQFTLSEFGQQPASYFLDLDGLAAHFSRFGGALWAVEKRIGLERVTLKYARLEAFEDALLSGL